MTLLDLIRSMPRSEYLAGIAGSLTLVALVFMTALVTPN